MWEIYNPAYVLVGYLVFTGMKWAVLESRSTITHMQSYLFCVRGKPTMESMWRSSHFHEGTANGCSCLADSRWSVSKACKPCGYLVAIQVMGEVTGVVWSSQSLLSLPRCRERFYTDPSNLLHEQHYSLMVRYQGFWQK